MNIYELERLANATAQGDGPIYDLLIAVWQREMSADEGVQAIDWDVLQEVRLLIQSHRECVEALKAIYSQNGFCRGQCYIKAQRALARAGV